MKIYVLKGKEKCGPYTVQEIAARLASGEFSGTDMGWSEGAEEWRPLVQILRPETQMKTHNQRPAPPKKETPLRYAGFWKRVGAMLFDMFLLGILGFVLGLLLSEKLLDVIRSSDFPNLSDHLEQRMLKGAWFFLLGPIITWLYFAIFESSAWQATPGKLMLKIQVTDLRGERIGFGRATMRCFAKAVPGIGVGIVGSIIYILLPDDKLFVGTVNLILSYGSLLSFFMAGWTKQKRALHDFIARTLVINEPVVARSIDALAHVETPGSAAAAIAVLPEQSSASSRTMVERFVMWSTILLHLSKARPRHERLSQRNL